MKTRLNEWSVQNKQNKSSQVGVSFWEERVKWFVYFHNELLIIDYQYFAVKVIIIIYHGMNDKEKVFFG